MLAILRNVAGCFLNANDVRNLSQPQQGGGLDVDGGARLHAIDNNRQRGGFGDGAVMLIESFLRRLVVVRGDG